MRFEKIPLPSGVKMYALPLLTFISFAHPWINNQSRVLPILLSGKLVSRTISLMVAKLLVSSEIALMIRPVSSSWPTPMGLLGFTLCFSKLRSFMPKIAKMMIHRIATEAQINAGVICLK